MKIWYKFIILFVSSVSLMGCLSFIHEFPELPPDIPVSLRITEIYLDNYFEEDIIPGLIISRGDIEEKYKIRFTIKLYINNNLTDSRQLVETWRQDRRYPVNILYEKLKREEYRIVVWAEFVQDNGESIAYEYEDITYITQCIPYRGSTEDKDAFSISKTEDLREAKGEVTDQLSLSRPFGKFRIIATNTEQLTETGEYTVEQIGRMTVTLSYTSFFPCAYNAVTNRPNDANTGFQFTGSVEWVNEEHVKGLMLAFDYVWVNSTKSSVTAQLTVHDELGKQIAKINNIHIPYERGRLTTIIGEFTDDSGSNGDSGIGINPDFDGIYEITLP